VVCKVVLGHGLAWLLVEVGLAGEPTFSRRA